MANLATVLRPGGWLAFDLHTEAMLQLTLAAPVVSGREAGTAFVLTSTVDRTKRACDTRIDVEGSFSEVHRQYFHRDDEVRTALARAGFGRVAVVDEYSGRAAGPETLRATWVARRVGDPGFEPGTSALSERRSNQLS